MVHDDILTQLSPQPFYDIRNNIQTGDILLCSGTGVISNMIKKVTNSSFSHVALILQLPITEQWLILESIESVGVRCVTLQEGYLTNYMDSGTGYRGNMLIARHKAMHNKSEYLDVLYQTAFSLTGDKYSREDIFKIATRIALNKIGIHESGVVKENDRYICSEYLYACYKAIGINLPYDPLGFIAPSSISNLDDVFPIAHVATDHLKNTGYHDSIAEAVAM